MKRLAAFVLVAQLAACNSSVGSTPATPAAVRCRGEEAFDGRGCRPLSAEAARISNGTAELAAFRPEEARALLEEARRFGPWLHRDHVRLYEELGIAYAYLGEDARALDAFDMLLALSPGHAISYTLSPRVTFLFERARAAARLRRQPEIRVSWPRDLDVTSAVPIEIEVTSDPRQFLDRARVHARRRGGKAYGFVDVELEPAGTYRRVVLPPVAPDARRAEVLEIYVAASDAQGNQVLLWGDASAPRSVPLAYHPAAPWYERWWVWAIAGGVVAGATGAAVFAAAQEPPDRVDGTFSAR